MKIGILSFSIAMGNGQSRFAVNLSRGLKKMGTEVALFAYSCDSSSKVALSELGISVYSFKESLNFSDMYRSVSESRHVYESVSELIKKSEICDYYIVLSDELIGISAYRTNEKWIYLTQGDMIFLFLNERFLVEHAPFSRIKSTRFVSQLLKHQRAIRKYDAIIANSRFTAEIMSFFLDSLITEYVYPPVDTEKFKPIHDSFTNPYALVLLRSNAEPLAQYVEKFARIVPLRIVGNAFINGAETLGRVSDSELIELYSKATVTVTASLQEFFGYSTAESLACGTPVISFNHGGAAELIIDGFNGWLVKSDPELINRLKEIFDKGYDEIMRKNSRESTSRFSIEASSKKLVGLLAKT